MSLVVKIVVIFWGGKLIFCARVKIFGKGSDFYERAGGLLISQWGGGGGGRLDFFEYT